MHIIKSSHWPNPSQFIKSPSPLSCPPSSLVLLSPWLWPFVCLSPISSLPFQSYHVLLAFSRERETESVRESCLRQSILSRVPRNRMFSSTLQSPVVYFYIYVSETVYYLFFYIVYDLPCQYAVGLSRYSAQMGIWYRWCTASSEQIRQYMYLESSVGGWQMFAHLKTYEKKTSSVNNWLMLRLFCNAVYGKGNLQSTHIHFRVRPINFQFKSAY